MRHRFGDQDLAKELMGVPSGIQFCFADFAKQCCVIVLNVDRAWLDCTMDHVAIVQGYEAFAYVT